MSTKLQCTSSMQAKHQHVRSPKQLPVVNGLLQIGVGDERQLAGHGADWLLGAWAEAVPPAHQAIQDNKDSMKRR